MIALKIFVRATSAIGAGQSSATARNVTRSLSSLPQLSSSRNNNACTASFTYPAVFPKHIVATDTNQQSSLKMNATEGPKVLRLPSSNLINHFVYTVPLGYYAPIRQSTIISDKNLPPIVHKEYSEPMEKRRQAIEDPLDPSGANIIKQAARLIVIRRTKMNKHKLRKLRKKMRYVWARVKQRRALRKEKVFQTQLLTRFRQADEFSAEQWVDEFLHKSKTDPKTLFPLKEKRVRPIRYVFK